MVDRTEQLIYDGHGEKRLDKYIVQRLPQRSRSQVQKLIKAGNVTVNGVSASKTGQFLEPGAVIVIKIPPISTSNLIPETIPLDVIFENTDVLVINKPPGIVVHPSAGHSTGTLVHAALAHSPDIEGIGGVLRPGVIHRLDKNTSGLIIMAKNDRAHHWIQDQFKDRQVKKRYLALVDGKPPTGVGKVDAAIGRDLKDRKRMAVVPLSKGRNAITDYKMIKLFSNHAYLTVYPLTGRTHQIRVHLAFLGCPVVGDTIYGYRHPSIPIKRHFLHAASLTLSLPGDVEPRKFEAPLPDDLQEAIDLVS